jgi:hypothetical protein
MWPARKVFAVLGHLNISNNGVAFNSVPHFSKNEYTVAWLGRFLMNYSSVFCS